MQFNCTYPESWKTSEMEGKDWMTSSLKRNPTFTIRKPRATSLARASSFNKRNLGTFFNNLGSAYDEHGFEVQDVWNMEKTGIKTVQAPEKIIVPKGLRQIGAITSSEKGGLTDCCCCGQCAGEFYSPFLYFPSEEIPCTLYL